MDLVDVTSIRILEGFEVEFTFSDGVTKRIDLDAYVRGPIFQPLRDDPAYFRSAFVDPEAGVISWPNGADIDTQVLRYDLRPARWDEEGGPAFQGLPAGSGAVRATDQQAAKLTPSSTNPSKFDASRAARPVITTGAVPIISRFFGIVIQMYFREHQPPHFHAEYGEYRASIGIDPVSVLAGELPPRALGLVMEWAKLHTAALLADWERAQRREPLDPVAPLR